MDGHPPFSFQPQNCNRMEDTPRGGGGGGGGATWQSGLVGGEAWKKTLLLFLPEFCLFASSFLPSFLPSFLAIYLVSFLPWSILQKMGLSSSSSSSSSTSGNRIDLLLLRECLPPPPILPPASFFCLLVVSVCRLERERERELVLEGWIKEGEGG